MPFPFFVFLIRTYIYPENVFKETGEEVGFDFSHSSKLSCSTGKVSESTSDNLNGSVTVEAIVCIPLFLYAACSLIWLLEIRSVQTTIRSGLQFAGKQLAEDAFSAVVLVPSMIEEDLICAVGEERLESSILVGGSGGVSCKKSYTIPGSGIYELCAEFYIKLPFPYYASNGIRCEERMRVKGWNGYVSEALWGMDTEDTVYVTETGVVYHLDAHCSYLEPSIRAIQAVVVDSLRNEGGEKYDQCPKCVNKKDSYEMFYITNYGHRYHSTLACSGIKRTVYEVPISEAKGKVVCSKCGK